MNKQLKCKYCNASGLRWHKGVFGIVLVDSNHKRHQCQKKLPPTFQDHPVERIPTW